MRWINLFERELAAVQKVQQAVGAGAKLAPDDVRAASEAAEKLLGIIMDGRERVTHPQPA